MDIMYLPDAIAYPSLRGTPNLYSYEHEEPLWTKQQTQVKQQQSQQQVTSDKRSGGHGGTGGCPLCKERQRRRLASYIRTKSRQDSECTIEEEEETEKQQEHTKQTPA